jgi:hypothetical protein
MELPYKEMTQSGYDIILNAWANHIIFNLHDYLTITQIVRLMGITRDRYYYLKRQGKLKAEIDKFREQIQQRGDEK